MASRDALRPILVNINKSLSRLREDVQNLTGEVKKIPEILEKGFKQLRDAIHENIEAQAELKLMEQMIKVSSVEPQIEAEKEQIDSIRNDLNDRLDQINERYERKHDELDETAEERIRDLGSHIFAIDEDQFQDGIEDPFTSQVTPTWGDLQAHNQKTNKERATQIRDSTEHVVDDIEQFLERQRELLSQIDNHLFDPDTVPIETTEPVEFQLPYYVVEYVENGEQRRKVIPPSVMGQPDESDSWSAATIDPIRGSSNLIPNEMQIDESQATEVYVSQDSVTEELDDYGKSSNLGPSYKSAVSDTLPEQFAIEIEGGDS